MTNISHGPNLTGYSVWFHPTNHGMAGFGYSVITYTLPSGKPRTDRFIRVATGHSSRPTAFFNINFQGQIISRVYAVVVS